MSDREHQTDIEAIQVALKQTGELLHGIVSRSDIKQIAAEVLRLNEAVRRGAAGRAVAAAAARRRAPSSAC